MQTSTFFAGMCFGLLACTNPDPITVAVVLDSQTKTTNTTALEWAVGQVNEAADDQNARPLELHFYGAEYPNAEEAVWAALLDGHAAIIGPPDNADFAVAGELAILNETVLVSPTTTAGSISRMFKDSPYIWRTTQSDISQAQAMALIAYRRGAERVALLTGFSDYGTTFFDWFNFFAVELGLDVTTVERFQDNTSCYTEVTKAVRGSPDIIFATPESPQQTVCIAQAIQSASQPPQLFLSEAGMDPLLLSELGVDAEGIEGFVLTAHPQSGFALAYQNKFARALPAYGANMYDAVLLLAYGLYRTEGVGGEDLAMAMAEIVAGRGDKVSWDAKGIARGFEALSKGWRPDIEGASGSLVYPRDRYTDLQATMYGLWRVENGQFVVVDYFSSGEGSGVAHGAQALFETTAGQFSDSNLTRGSYEPAQPATGLKVVIVATSNGWSNYRHQSDALAQYQHFRQIGLSDDDIIMIGADDLIDDPTNKDSAVYNGVGGPNMYWDVQYDYRLDEIDADKLEQILLGQASEATPVVLESGAQDNLYMFFVGHGGKSGVAIDASTAMEAEGGSADYFSPESLAYIMNTLRSQNKFSRAFITVEACHGGVMGSKLSTPGVLLLAAATENENSLSAEYDTNRRIWLANQFARNLYVTLPTLGLMTFRDLFSELYLSVSGSHVTMVNEGEFGDIFSLTPDSFFYPSGITQTTE